MHRARLVAFYTLMIFAVALQLYPVGFICADIFNYRKVSMVSAMAYGSVLPFSIPAFILAVVGSYRLKVAPVISIWIACYLISHAVALLVFYSV